MWWAMLPGLLLLAGCTLPPSAVGSVSNHECLFPDNPALLLPGFDPAVNRVIEYKRSDFDADGHMDTVLLTGTASPGGDLGMPESTALDVLSCQAPGKWTSLFHTSLPPLEDARLLICDCNWEEDSAPLGSTVAVRGQGSSIITLTRSTGASGWTLSLNAFGFRYGVVKPLFSDDVHNGDAAIEGERFVVSKAPQGWEAAQGIPVKRWTYRRSPGDGAFQHMDLPSDSNGPRQALAATSEQDAVRPAPAESAAVATTTPAPVFGELSFCTDDGFDPLRDRCLESRSSFDGTTKRVFYSWFPTGVQAGMLYGQTWWLDGVMQAAMSSPPRPPKIWDDFIWRGGEYNYDFIDGCSRDDKKVCADSLAAGEYRVALTVNGSRVADGRFTIGR